MSAATLLASCGLLPDAQVSDPPGAASVAPVLEDLRYSVVLSPDQVVVNAGATTTSVVQVILPTPSTRQWTLSGADWPTGVTGSFDPGAVATGDSAALKLMTLPTCVPGTYSFTVTATSDPLSFSAVGSLEVVASGNGGGFASDGGGIVAIADAGVVAIADGGLAVIADGGGGPVGRTGGTVNLLHFAITGDTRPPNCEDTANYPTPIIDAIADAAKAKGAQFALDLGDHMFVCNNDLAVATAQMNLYMGAIARLQKTWFMTMGNHECFHGPCFLNSQNANYVAYMNALAPLATKPYYSFNVQTSLGRATFVTIADNAWDATQAAWLTQTLADADAHSTYTLVARHHPEADTSVATNPDIMAIVRAHKFALFLSGHTHTYHHGTTDNGRDLVMGIGGAPLISGGAFNGYGMIDQLPNGRPAGVGLQPDREHAARPMVGAAQLNRSIRIDSRASRARRCPGVPGHLRALLVGDAALPI